MGRLGLWVWRRAYRPFSSHRVQEEGLATVRTWHCGYWPWPPCSVSVIRILLRRAASPPSRYHPLWQDITTLSPHVRSGGLWSASLKVKSLHKSFGFLLKGRIVSLPLFVYLFNQLGKSEWTQTFILSFGLLPRTLRLLTQIVSPGPSGAPSCGLWVILTHLRLVGGIFVVVVLFWACPSFRLLQEASGTFCVFPALVLKSAISLRSPNSFFKKKKKVYLSIFMCQVLVVACRIFLTEACELLVAKCGIMFPDQGLNLGLLHWECGVLAIEPPGKSS